MYQNPACTLDPTCNGVSINYKDLSLFTLWQRMQMDVTLDFLNPSYDKYQAGGVIENTTRSDPLYHKKLRGQIAPRPRFVKMVDLKGY